jgi:hypothetical protein
MAKQSTAKFQERARRNAVPLLVWPLALFTLACSRNAREQGAAEAKGGSTVRIALPAVDTALEAEVAALSLQGGTVEKYSYVPFHLALRVSNAAGFERVVTVNPKSPEIALEVPTGAVKIDAILFGLPVPEGKALADTCRRESKTETTADSQESSPTGSSSTGGDGQMASAPPGSGTSPEGGTGQWTKPLNYISAPHLNAVGFDGGGGNSNSRGDDRTEFIFVSQVSQTVDVKVDTEALPVNFPALRAALMEPFGARVLAAGRPLTNTTFPLLDVSTRRPILDPCDGKAITLKTDSRGRLVDNLPEVGGGAPLFALGLPAPRTGFVTINLNTTSTLGRFFDIDVDARTSSPMATSTDFFGVKESLQALSSRGIDFVKRLLNAAQASFDDGTPDAAPWVPGLPPPAPQVYIAQFEEPRVVRVGMQLQCNAVLAYENSPEARLAAEFQWFFKGVAQPLPVPSPGSMWKPHPAGFTVPMGAALGDPVRCDARTVQTDAQGNVTSRGAWASATVSVTDATPIATPMSTPTPPPDGQGGGVVNGGEVNGGGGGEMTMPWWPSVSELEVFAITSTSAVARLNFDASGSDVDGLSVAVGAGSQAPLCAGQTVTPVVGSRRTYTIPLSSGIVPGASHTVRVCPSRLVNGIREHSTGMIAPYLAPNSNPSLAIDPAIPPPEDFQAISAGSGTTGFGWTLPTNVPGAVTKKVRVYRSSGPQFTSTGPLLVSSHGATNAWHTDPSLPDGAPRYYRALLEVVDFGNIPRFSVPTAPFLLENARMVSRFLTADAPASSDVRDIAMVGGGFFMVATSRGLSITHDAGLNWDHRTRANGLRDDRILRVRVRPKPSGQDVCVVHEDGNVSWSYDGGRQWQSADVRGHSANAVAKICDFRHGELLIGTENGITMVRQGAWSHHPGVNITDLAWDSGQVYASGPDGVQRVLEDGTLQSILTGANVRNLHSRNGYLFATLFDGQGLRVRTPSGAWFTPSFAPDSFPGIGFENIDGIDYALVASAAQVHRAPMQGLSAATTWSASPLGQSFTLPSPLAAGNLYARGQNAQMFAASGGLYVKPDGGPWTLRAPPPALMNPTSAAEHFANMQHTTWVLSRPSNSLAKSTDNRTWESVQLPGGVVPRKLVLVGSELFLTANDGLYLWTGTSWSSLLSGMQVFDVVRISGAHSTYLAATSTGLKASADFSAWTPVSGSGCNAISTSPSKALTRIDASAFVGTTGGDVVRVKPIDSSTFACSAMSASSLGTPGEITALVSRGTESLGEVRGISNTTSIVIGVSANSMSVTTSVTLGNLASVSLGQSGFARFADIHGVGDTFALVLEHGNASLNAILLLNGPGWTALSPSPKRPSSGLWRSFAIAGVSNAPSSFHIVSERGIVYGGMPFDAIPPSIVGAPALEHRLFVTSQDFLGDLGGLAGADARCQGAADSVSLGGAWKAVLSSSTVAARDRITITGPVVSAIGGNLIANDYSDFFDGTVDFPLKTDEWGTYVFAGSYAWTGSTAMGEISKSDTCSDWTSNAGAAAIGDPNSPSMSLGFDDARCSNTMRLYCIEQ